MNAEPTTMWVSQGSLLYYPENRRTMESSNRGSTCRQPLIPSLYRTLQNQVFPHLYHRQFTLARDHLAVRQANPTPKFVNCTMLKVAVTNFDPSQIHAETHTINILLSGQNFATVQYLFGIFLVPWSGFFRYFALRRVFY